MSSSDDGKLSLYYNDANSGHNSDNDNDTQSTCPLCLEDLDTTDKQFNPCVCSYQICLWCWHSIIEKGNGLCPACRTPYQRTQTTSSGTQSLTTYDAEQLIQSQTQRRKEKRAAQQHINKSINNVHSNNNASNNNSSTQSTVSSGSMNSSDDLTDIRIIQRNLVYVVGLPQHIARSDIIQKKELFGKYGKILKVACSRAPKIPIDKTLNSYSAYITFKQDSAALECIKQCDGSTLDGHTTQPVRCTFGTTKYCETWLNGRTCTSQTCLYLHSRAKPADITTKEQLTLMWQNERAHEPNHGVVHTHNVSPSNTNTPQQQINNTTINTNNTVSSHATVTTPTNAPSTISSEHTRQQSQPSYAAAIHTASHTVSNTMTTQPSHSNDNTQSSAPITDSKSQYTTQLSDSHILMTANDTAEQNNIPIRSHLVGVPSTRLHISTNYSSRLRLQSTHLPFDFSNFLTNILNDIPAISPEQLFNTVDDTNQLIYVQAVK